MLATIFSEKALPQKHAQVLSTLDNVGAATSAELEVKSGLIGANVEGVLSDLKAQGLVDYRSRYSGGESVKIYYRTK